MPLVRFTTSVAGPDFAYGPGDGEVRVTAERAQEFLHAGWAELVRHDEPETPERPSGGAGLSVETTDGGMRKRRVQRRG